MILGLGPGFGVSPLVVVFSAVDLDPDSASSNCGRSMRWYLRGKLQLIMRFDGIGLAHASII